MFPQEFTKRLKSQKYIDAEALLKALEEPSPVSIRINPAKWGKIPSDSERVPWCSNGYYLKTRPSYTLDPLLHSGCYLSLIHISEPTRQAEISYAVFCLKKKKKLQ